MAYSHRQTHLNASNDSDFIAEMVTAQVLAFLDILFHAQTADNNATSCEGKVYTTVANR
jgi:hypothetical protein